MVSNLSQILFFLEVLLFGSVIFMHLSKKSSTVVSLYAAQSFIVVILLLNSFFKNPSALLAITIAVIFAVKVIVAPKFFFGLVKRHQLKFSASTYLNDTLTLVALAILTALTYSHYFSPLAVLAPQNEKAVLLAVAMMLVSIFLLINRKGVLSQMIGILSLENAIVSFAFLAGLEETPGLQLGIIFDILVWVIIATVFASMIYKQFGTLDVSAMKNLKEE